MINTLRDLRLYHWRKANACRALAIAEKKGPGFLFLVAPIEQKADFHLKCVQLLNEVVSGNAEQDDVGIPSTEQTDR